MEKSLQNTIIIVLIIVGIAFFYALVWSPEQNKKELNACLINADQWYEIRWNKYCKEEGEGPDCALPNYRADEVNQYYKEMKNDCYQQYP